VAIEDDHARRAILVRNAAALPLPATSHGSERVSEFFSIHAAAPMYCMEALMKAAAGLGSMALPRARS
jgi:hypothetical protein